MSNSLALLGGRPTRTKPFPTWPISGAAEEKALLQTLRSGHWGKIDGEQVFRFEKRFAEYCQAKHAIAVCNGTISIQIALMAAGIKAGDEVIVPPYTFLATATAVLAANATPIFADINLETFNLDPAAIERAITPRTRAIIPVHLGGLPCDMDPINAIAKKHHLTVIEDAAHAHGSEYKNRRTGSLSHFASFSFQSSKNLNCGEGGIILTSDDELAESCRSIHNCGRIATGPWYEHHVMNGNYRLGEFQAAILNCQLDRLDDQTNTRDTNGKYLDAHLARIPGLAPQKRTPDATRVAYHLYSFRFNQESFSIPRARFLEALTAEGIPCSPGYTIPLYRQPLFVNKSFGPYTGCLSTHPDLDYGKVRLPHCEQICQSEGVWFTQNLLLGSRSDMDDIIAAIRKTYDQRALLGGSGSSATSGSAGAEPSKSIVNHGAAR